MRRLFPWCWVSVVIATPFWRSPSTCVGETDPSHSFNPRGLESRCDNVGMAWIETIPEDDAQGDLRRSYEAAGMRAGKVWNIVKLMSLSPATLRASMGLYVSSVQASSPLTRAQREMLAVVVSKTNNCHY